MTVTSTISSAGIGSGLDVTSIISKLMAVEQLPLTALQTQATSMQTKLSSFGQIQSLFSTLQDSSTALADKSAYNVTKATSTSTAISATTSTGAVAGNYSVSVSSIAAAQTAVSAAGQFGASTDIVGTGSITITLGTLATVAGSPSTFTQKSGSTAVTIPIDSTDNSLQGVANAINQAGAGVQASIVTDSSGSRLAITSTATGAANGFTVSTTDSDTTNSDASGLSRLAFDPTGSTSQMTLAQSAADTQATINGIAVKSATTDLSNVVTGVSFTANQVTTSAVTVAVSNDTDSVKTLMTNFVAAYNALHSYMTTQTAYDASTQTAGLLQGDSTTVSLENQMRAMVSASGSGSTTFSTLSSMGIQMQKDGSLLLDDATSAKALANLPEMAKAFAAVDVTNSANNGFATKLKTWTTDLLGSDGSIATKENSIQSQITANGKSQSALSDQITATQARLTAQYNALDVTMSQASALAAYVQQQFYPKTSTTS